ncbi:hypothetical protein DM01DRAFT_1384945 [Hesseltinella vesiculosa]|uniref:Protein YOP1 n=1 Tax=Hesseltinella vesiculosa TaxID=101127 RepID=A0A1X2GC30_9FUNG|nr:hypothetical protein DM01DRAFT_1384945 [Hesseltinella vesiculosa]
MSKRSESISSFSSVEERLRQLQDPRLHATSLLIQQWLVTLNRRSPINLRLFTLPIGKATIQRLVALESLYGRSAILSFLLRRGVPPVPLFLGASATLAWLLKRLYTRHQYLSINAVGVLYPAWRCWHLVKQLDTQGPPLEQIKECKSWLTYWMLYGSLQVLDNWGTDVLYMFPNYNLYKLAILYWAQNPHSKGATMLYQSILQKPEDEASSDTHSEYNEPEYPEQIEQASAYRRTPLFDDKDELTITIGQGNGQEDEQSLSHHHHRSSLATPTSYRILDGYTPTSLTPYSVNGTGDANQSSGSSSPNSDQSPHHYLHRDPAHHAKPEYPSLLVHHPMATDATW